MNTSLTCPKCSMPMRTIDRKGVTIERCVECGGVFLDRGELEHLSEAEHDFYERPEPQRANARGYNGDDDDYEDRPRRRKKKGRTRDFLEDLLDFG